MTPGEVETVYEALALNLDAVGATRRELFLAKLALLLSYDLGDADRVCLRIEEAARNIDH
ncbi:hypothetical protein [Ruegeria marina]|uniref:DUF2783 domain-containing protein n=1 Tax=Ruegeria marina TaxID=639004 RepID=A0A1G7EZH2_9RHOB|nr:hypothetical protein [Ruegeria marina]SDE69083.1 hypothetical protein SAMN04488239_12821 [Ruegeria marina]SDE76047.1 hypothetical protein SAMN04488239_13514 [Ruegeria marina]